MFDARYLRLNDSQDADSRFMLRALQLAERGRGRVSPNPLVGCLLVRNGEVIGEGAHEEFGGPHAEVRAIENAEAANQSVEGATAYVSLEPHAHFGKTPPCADLFIRKKIARCVVAVADPNPKVAGRGIAMLRDAEIEVDVGVLESEAREQNRFFFKHITSGKPYVTLKLAQSLDGRAALGNGLSQWITSEESRREVHKMRAWFDGVLVGSGTALSDDPSLTVRMVGGRQPWRIVLDTKLQLPTTLRLFTDEYRQQTLLVASKEATESSASRAREFDALGVQIIGVETSSEYVSLASLFAKLAERGIASVLIEAGPRLAASVIREGEFDEIVSFVAPRILGADAKPSIGELALDTLDVAHPLRIKSVRQIPGSQDIEIVYRKQSWSCKPEGSRPN